MPYGMLVSASLKRKPQRRAAWQGGILSAIGNNRSIEGGHEYEENAMDLRAGPADKSPRTVDGILSGRRLAPAGERL